MQNLIINQNNNFNINQEGLGSTGWLWGLWSTSVAFVWLIPLHLDPWRNFYNAVAASGSLCFLALILVLSRVALTVDTSVVVIVVTAAIPLAQAMGGMFTYPSEAPIVALYLIAFGVTVALGRSAQHRCPDRFQGTFLSGLLIAALISGVLAFAQLFQLNWGDLLAVPLVRSRPFANVGQPNELGTLLIWGTLALLYFRWKRQIPNWLALVGLIFLFASIITTRSRTAWLSITIIHALAFTRPAYLGLSFKHARRTVVASFVLFAVSVGAWEIAMHWFELAEGISSQDRLEAGLRPELWRMVIDGISLHPWLGYGWNQGRLLQLDTLPNYCNLQLIFQDAHDVFLDLLVWNGIPLGLALIGAIVSWFVYQFRHSRTPDQWIVMLMIVAFGIHASLELPHTKLLFLIPVGLMIGTLNSHTKLSTVFQLKWPAVGLLTLVGVAVITLSFKDFSAIQADLLTYRLRTAGIYVGPVTKEPEIYILDGIQAALRALRITPTQNMTPESLMQVNKVAKRYPSELSLMLKAQTEALNGKPLQAKQALTQLCLIDSGKACRQITAIWNGFKDKHPETLVTSMPVALCKWPK